MKLNSLINIKSCISETIIITINMYDGVFRTLKVSDEKDLEVTISNELNPSKHCMPLSRMLRRTTKRAELIQFIQT